MIWSAIGAGVLDIVKGFVQTRQATRAAKLRLEIAKFESKARIEEAKAQHAINMAQNAQFHEHDWEKIMASNSGNSWKDEFILILFSIPLIMSFIPGLSDYVSLGFQALERAPAWYLQVVLAGAAVAYGLRNLTKLPISLPNPLRKSKDGTK